MFGDVAAYCVKSLVVGLRCALCRGSLEISNEIKDYTSDSLLGVASVRSMLWTWKVTEY
jgi:hypothetical protein